MGQALCKCASGREGQTREANPLHAGSSAQPVAHIISKSHSDLSDLQEAEGSYGKEEIKNRPVVVAVTAGPESATPESPDQPNSNAGEEPCSSHAGSRETSPKGNRTHHAEDSATEDSHCEVESGAESDTSLTSEVELLRDYHLLAELLSFSPYPVTLIDIEPEHSQPIVFANQVFLKALGYTEDDVMGKPWTDFLKTPFGHEMHSDVQSRISEAFETGCEFRETAACDTKGGDLTTLQLLFLPVCKNPDSGITHYVCIHVASQTSKSSTEKSAPLPLPNLPKWADDVPTARYVSITMKNHAPEQLLGGNAEALGAMGIRVGSFNGMPRVPKVRRPSSLGLAAAATPVPVPVPAPVVVTDADKKSPPKVSKQNVKKSRFAPASDQDGMGDDVAPTALGRMPIGNLRHDSALMGAISSQKGKMTANMANNRVPRTKEEVWLHRLRDLLTSPLEDLNKTQ